MDRPYVSSKIDSIEPEGAYVVLSRAQELERAGRSIIHLEIGEPDSRTDRRICEAAIEAIQRGKTRYTPATGIPMLRSAIAEQVSERCGRTVDPSEVVVAPGAKPMLFLPTLAVLDPGDEVIFPNPGFPSYESMVRVAGGRPVPVPLREEANFRFDLDYLREVVSDRTKLIVLNSPSNPTGGVIPFSDLKVIADIAQRFNCWVMSDEIYRRMCFEQTVAPSITSIDGMADRTILVDGFSKTYSMTGWRLGYGVMPSGLAEKVGLLAVHAVGCTAHFTQLAGVAGLRIPDHELDSLMLEYQHRRDVLVDGLNSIPGIRCNYPEGAFYAFPNIRELGRSSDELATRLLEDAGVAVLPGTAFGSEGEGYLRLCFANSVSNLKEAIERIRDCLQPGA